jgi:hypothetical protein
MDHKISFVPQLRMVKNSGVEEWALPFDFIAYRFAAAFSQNATPELQTRTVS